MKRLSGTFWIVSGLLAVLGLWFFLAGGTESYQSKYAGADLATDLSGIGRSDSYTRYLLSCQGYAPATRTVPVNIASFSSSGGVEVRGEGVYTAEGSIVTWQVVVPEEGMYSIYIKYLTVPSRGVDVERELKINGEVPFAGAERLVFSRLWTNGGLVRKDNQGNDIRPAQVEVFDWQTAWFRDDMGYVTVPYQFYFPAGDNTLTLRAVNEPVIIGELTLLPQKQLPAYTEYAQAQPESASNDTLITLQGEDAFVRSSPSLYPRYDRSSPATLPYDVRHTILNYIGGDPWNSAGQWIEWNFEVPQDGYYNITLKARQAYQRGAISCRTLYIDGQIPFDALDAVPFKYGNAWSLNTLRDDAGKPYRFYLTAGTHTLRMESTLGEMGPILKRLEDSIYRLNQIYRRIMVLTGPNPDLYRDYSLNLVYPEIITAMSLESKRLYKIVDDIVAITGQKSDRVAVAETLAVQLESFVENNERITQSFTYFKDNITALGTAMQSLNQTKLDIDLIYISGDGAKLPQVHDNALNKWIHEVRSCFASYTVDYNALGNVYSASDDVLSVWIVTGRDQSTVLKAMVDDTFTPDTGIRVNVKLVDPNALLTAVVAGNGPDLVISLDNWFPVNYALRGAAENLRQFSDFDLVSAQFAPSSFAALTYNDGVYALPETQTFNVLFYRKDILDEYGLNVPGTWQDLLDMLPTIQGSNMSVGIPYPDIIASNISVFNSMLYQYGGSIYDQSGKRTLIDNEQGVSAFTLFTSLYNDYGMPKVFDFVSRFRSGEMPIGIADFSVFNYLTVAAPEIRGLWNFAMIPGAARTREDGASYIDRSVHAQGACCMMIASDNEEIKQKAWSFMRWWVSTDTQVRFGREIESILGASARYPTANKDAFERTSWNAEQLKVLREQRKYTVGYREVPGGYSTTRHITNAIRRVINTKEDARETLLNYARTINKELAIKRKEFGLPVE